MTDPNQERAPAPEPQQPQPPEQVQVQAGPAEPAAAADAPLFPEPRMDATHLGQGPLDVKTLDEQ